MDLSSHGGGEIPIHMPLTIPMPLSSKYVGVQPEHHHHHHHHHNQQQQQCYGMNMKKPGGGAVVRYRECLKNHAAAIGGNATDGCGEFMPSGEEGSMEALKCSACSCHRNFHRKEVDGESSSFSPYDGGLYPHHHQLLKGRSKVVGKKGVLVSSHNADPFGYGHTNILTLPSPHHMILPLGAIQTSESDEMAGGGGGGGLFLPPSYKKRFRTKFTPEQKEKMLAFAENVGWRLQKQEDAVVQQFCQDIGVKRRVLKVWMHNNKHSLSKKTAAADPFEIQAPPPPLPPPHAADRL